MILDSDMQNIIDSALKKGSNESARYRLMSPVSLQRGPAGIHLGNRIGSSIDFHDFREYQPGDDLRRVDWAAYARNNVLSIKLFQEEISPVVEIIVDQSASMGLYAEKVYSALFLASFLVNVTRNSEGRPVLINQAQKHTGREIDFALSQMRFNVKVESPYVPGHECHGKPVRFYISDFLFPENMEALLRKLNRNTAVLVPLMVLSEDEWNPDLRGACRLVDCEYSKWNVDMEINERVISEYKNKLNAHINSIEWASHITGSSFVQLAVQKYKGNGSEISGKIIDQLLNMKLVEVV